MTKKGLKPTLPVATSPIEDLIAEKAAQGYSVEAIAKELVLDVAEVSDLIKKPTVQAEIQRASQEVLKQFGSKESIKNAMKRIIMSDLTDFYQDDGKGNLMFKPINEIPMYLRQCITKLKVKNATDNFGMPVQNVELEVISKEKAIEILARLEGLFKEDNEQEDNVINIGWT